MLVKWIALLVLGQSLPLIPGLSLRQQSSFLLFDPAVAKRLDLSASQATALDTVIEAYNDRKNGLIDGKASAEDAKYVENDRRFASEASAVLTEVQRGRLFTVALRSRGIAALADPEVARTVGLSGTALAKVQATVKNMDARDGKVADEFAAALEKLPPPAKPSAAYDKKVADLEKAALAKETARANARKAEEAALLASLSAPVRSRWTALVS